MERARATEGADDPREEDDEPNRQLRKARTGASPLSEKKSADNWPNLSV